MIAVRAGTKVAVVVVVVAVACEGAMVVVSITHF